MTAPVAARITDSSPCPSCGKTSWLDLHYQGKHFLLCAACKFWGQITEQLHG